MFVLRLVFRSRVIFTLVCLLSMVVATLGAKGQAVATPAIGGNYGSIAYSESLRQHLFAFADSKVLAEEKAWDLCMQFGERVGSQFKNDCNSAVWVHNGWLAISVDAKGPWGTGWGTSAYWAQYYANQTCENQGGTNCQIKGVGQTDNPQDSAEGGSGFGTPNFKLPWTGGEVWYYTGGPHHHGSEAGGVRYALDFAPPEVKSCPGSATLTNRWVVAAQSGTVVRAGDSIVEIDHQGGLRTGYMHLDNIQVKVGDSVTIGQQLGNPSCKSPPGGSTNGIHVHFYFELDGSPIPADLQVLSNWIVHSTDDNYQGTMTKQGEEARTADIGRCNDVNKGGCTVSGIRNDLLSDNS